MKTCTKRTHSLGLILLVSWLLASTSQVLLAGERKITVAFRYDDYSATSPTGLESRIIALFANANSAITFAVIPLVGNGAFEDPSPQDYLPLPPDKEAILRAAVQKGTVDVALHGYHHQSISEPESVWPSEFAGRDYQTQLDHLRDGRERLERAIGTRVGTFVPPWHHYDEATLHALSTLQFSLISAGYKSVHPSIDPCPIDFLPATSDLPGLRDAIERARKSSDRNPIIVVLLHPYDFSDLEELPNDDTTVFNPAPFSPADILNYASICEKLAAPSDPLSRYLFDLLTPADRILLSSDSTPVAEKRRVLVQLLNAAASNPQLHTSDRFTNIALSSATLDLQRRPLQGRRLGYLNRRLLEDAFPVELRKMQPTTTSFQEFADLVHWLKSREDIQIRSLAETHQEHGAELGVQRFNQARYIPAAVHTWLPPKLDDLYNQGAAGFYAEPSTLRSTALQHILTLYTGLAAVGIFPTYLLFRWPPVLRRTRAVHRWLLVALVLLVLAIPVYGVARGHPIGWKGKSAGTILAGLAMGLALAGRRHGRLKSLPDSGNTGLGHNLPHHRVERSDRSADRVA